jgi:hypothetical protein
MHHEQFKISIEGQELELRPTLRAACNLDRRYGGFEPLARAIADGSFRVIADVLLEGSSSNPLSRDALEYALGKSLAKFDSITPVILSFILACCGIDEAKISDSNAEASGKLESFNDHHTKLFRIATGWLGWTPQNAWDATPNEIMEAFKGRSEMLSAIFGGNSNPDNPVQTEIDNSPFDRSGFDELKGMMF